MNIQRREALQILELEREASWAQIQTAYRRLVFRWHPDVNPQAGSQERFREILAAYETLRDAFLQERARSSEGLAELYDDPIVKDLSVQELETRLRYSSSVPVRSGAAFLLGRIAGQRSRAALVAAARDRDIAVRRIAVRSLAQIGKLADLSAFLPLLFMRGCRHAYIESLATAVSRRLIKQGSLQENQI